MAFGDTIGHNARLWYICIAISPVHKAIILKRLVSVIIYLTELYSSMPLIIHLFAELSSCE